MGFSKVLTLGAPLTEAKKAIIMLHGRGGRAEQIAPLSKRVCDSTFHVVVPEAIDNVWYPHHFMTEERENEPALSLSIRVIKELIDKLAETIPQKQIYLLGFSQGACMSLEVSSRFATSYGGIIAFTGGLIGKALNPQKYSGNFNATPIFISNGTEDPFIPLERSEASKELMEALGAHVTLKIYPNRAHIISEDEVNWVTKHITQT